MSECLDFGIGSTAGTIHALQFQSIAQPDSWTYTPYARVETCGDGTKKGFGFPTATWTWDTLTQGEINRFLAFIDGTEASGTVYISTPTDRGGAGQIFDEFVCVMDRIMDGQGKTLVANTQRPVVYSGVTVSFSHLVES